MQQQHQQPVPLFATPRRPVVEAAASVVHSADHVLTGHRRGGSQNSTCRHCSTAAGSAVFLCAAATPNSTADDADGLFTANALLTPPSQMLRPSTPSGNHSGASARRGQWKYLSLPPSLELTVASPQLSAHVPQGKAAPLLPLCDFPRRLRMAVQHERSCPSSDTAVGAVEPWATPATAAVVATGEAGEASSSDSSFEVNRKSEAGSRTTPITTPRLAAESGGDVPPLATSSYRRRHPSPAVTGPVSIASSVVDDIDIAALAQPDEHRCTAGITNAPPAIVSLELLKRKLNGAEYINNYRILKSLGRGSCGKVKLAYDEVESRLVAIKYVRRVDTRKRLGGLTVAQKQYNAFMREVEVMKTLRHRNIVSLYEVIDDPSADKLYLVMQYVDKGVVAKVAVRANSDYVCDPIPPAQLVRYAREMLTGLQYLHRHDVVHRDLKPDNILVSRDGHAYLADFGVAETFGVSYRQRTESLMAASMAASLAMSVTGNRVGGPQVLGTKGTPLFIAPELWDGTKSYGKPVDMWATGVTLFTLLVGKLPFRSPEDIIDAAFMPTVPDEFGEKWRVLLNGLLHRAPQARWTVEEALRYVTVNLARKESRREKSHVALSETPCGSGASATSSTGAPATAVPLLSCRRRSSSNNNGDSDSDCSTDTEMHAGCVEFLPLPDEVEEALTPKLTCVPPLTAASFHLMPTVKAIPSSKAAGAAADGDEGEGKDDGASKSVLTSAFTSPFDTSPAMARALSSYFMMGQSTNACSAQLVSPLNSMQSDAMVPLPSNLAPQRLTPAQMGETPGFRGRRLHHHRGSSSSSTSRCTTHSKSRELPHHQRHISAAAAALSAQHKEHRRLAVSAHQQQINSSAGSGGLSVATSIPLEVGSRSSGTVTQTSSTSMVGNAASVHGWKSQEQATPLASHDATRIQPSANDDVSAHAMNRVC
ncbi:putative protein kinase [Leptomonas pyrrhocoris]|uniref:Protein kinase domain-containing protein n=1 Tax=Leptomonas pyrrhocoris TaxID=157538 RepID=A0A0M9FVM4_LEPPY|nr:putative protein kinase [Leptomonas pyrrhocoris]KPA76923.1 putative protein kinase [Leptomonas pyrrhocoris]|eukprot:XP_015655362.1 putative protein kinase [Leptomonas pyrrhocoris]